MATVGRGGQTTSERERATFPEKAKKWTLCVILGDLIGLSVDALFTLSAGCVMHVCVIHVWRKHWQLSCVNVSCCAAVQANPRSVIDVSLCCGRHEHCDFFCDCKERPINQL